MTRHTFHPLVQSFLGQSQAVTRPGVPLLALAVFVVDELEEEQVKDDDQNGNGHPENGWQPAKVVAVFVEGNHVMFMCRSCKASTEKQRFNGFFFFFAI